MADLVFNVAKGRTAYYASLPATNDALILVPLEATGLVADATMRDYTTLALLLAGASNEQTTATRKTLANVTVTIDQANDRVNIDADGVTYSGAEAVGNAVGAFVVCYDPDTTAGTDADLIPLSKHDKAWTPDGNDFVLNINDLIRAT